MELKKILIGLEGIKAKGNVDIEIKGIENNSKEVERAIQHVFDVCKKHNKAYGAVATSEEKIDNFISMGAQYIIYGSDTALYAKAANAAVRIFEKYR